ncbi:MAG: hypothetical protein L0Z50_16370 [Verrucomicrobiales bacterium]|nr:hypothetical protein [Verrucomicrobiales bacterium]
MAVDGRGLHLYPAEGVFENQETHHRKMTFQEEFIALLKKHRIEYDERYLWESFNRPFGTYAVADRSRQ